MNLPKPLAVLRKAPSKIDDDLELDNGSSSDSDQDDDALPAQSSPMPGPPSKSKVRSSHRPQQSVSGARSDLSAASLLCALLQMRDYSSDLDPTSSSPVKPSQSGPYSSQPTPLKRKRPLLEKMRAGQAAKKKGPTNDEVARTTKYDVVGVVKMKVVFSKRYVVVTDQLARPELELTSLSFAFPDLNRW